jgi:hypothetical protein
MPADAAIDVLDLALPARSLDALGPDLEAGFFAQLARCRVDERFVRLHAAAGQLPGRAELWIR